MFVYLHINFVFLIKLNTRAKKAWPSILLIHFVLNMHGILFFNDLVRTFYKCSAIILYFAYENFT